MSRLNKYLTLVFSISLFFLVLHAAHDAFVLDEAADWGVSYFEYFFYLALVYLTVPILGLFWARRGQVFGYLIVALYALQVMYGAGVTDDRPMIGLVPRLLGAFGIHIFSIHGYGFLTIILEILGVGEFEAHAPTLLSTLIQYANIGINAILLALCLLALYQWWQSRMHAAHTPNAAN